MTDKKKGKQESKKGKPSSAGRHGPKYARYFDRTAVLVERILRRMLRRNGAKAALQWATKKGPQSERLAKRLIAEREESRRNKEAEATTIIATPQKTKRLVVVQNQGLGPATMMSFCDLLSAQLGVKPEEVAILAEQQRAKEAEAEKRRVARRAKTKKPSVSPTTEPPPPPVKKKVKRVAVARPVAAPSHPKPTTDMLAKFFRSASK